MKKLKNYSPYIVCFIVLILFFSLWNAIENDMEKHIERISIKCANEGKGIKTSYTKEGDKYYICN